jgi:multiple sugar transport system substrate-binding protein
VASLVGGAALVGGLLLSGGAVSSASVGAHASASKTSASKTSVTKSGSLCGSLTLWTDATREPAVKDYQKAHPCVHLTTTVFGYTAGELQTKIGLFNKEGSGWPDVIWDPSTTDAGWLDSTRYDYAAVLNNGLVPTSTLNQWAFNSLSVCTYGGKVYCLRNDIAANVLWFNAPLMKKFGYKVPTTWEQYEAIGKEVAAQHPGYVVGTIGDGYAEDIYFWGGGCPSNGVGLHPHRQHARPADQGRIGLYAVDPQFGLRQEVRKQQPPLDGDRSDLVRRLRPRARLQAGAAHLGCG